MATWFDFEIWVGSSMSDATAGVPVLVITSPAGTARGTLALELAAADIQENLALVRGSEPALEVRQTFGKQLFDALFHGPVRDAWEQSCGRVDGGDAEGMRLRLLFDLPDLARLPWELLWDGERFLATVANLAVSRYLPVPEPPVLLTQEQLRVLLVIESPAGVPEVTPAEAALIEGALASLGTTVQHTTLRNPTLAQIHNALQQDFHVLHFLGHGTAGKLVITADDGQSARRIDDEDFAQLFQGRRHLRLVVLNACASSQTEEGGLFSGIGPALVQKRLPAVIAMQYPFVQLDTARRFSEQCYAALANGLPVDVAVNQARGFLSADGHLRDRDWSTPVLYMGTRGGQILSFVTAATNSVERAWQAVQQVAGESTEAKAALGELKQVFEQVARLHHQLDSLMELDRLLGQLRMQFGRCTELVDRAGGVPAKIPLGKLEPIWREVRQDQLDPLRVFVEGQAAELDTAAWLPELIFQSEAVDAAVKEGALRRLGESVSGLANQVAVSQAQVSRQLSQTIRDLVTLSERTLGRLGAV